jgi:tripartite-type tricarboxylate transporter receptor subunit TctC
MEFPRRRFLHLAAAATALPVVSRIARAQTYPTRPITMIVPFAPGGVSDVMGRMMAGPMREFLGQPIIIENAGGAGGSIGVGRAVRAPADGYTLSIGTTSSHVLTGALYSLQWDLVKDLEPIALLVSEPLMIVGRKSMPAQDLRELIAWLKANPDKASQGMAGVGGVGHVTGAYFQQETNTRFQFVHIAAAGQRCKTYWPGKSIWRWSPRPTSCSKFVPATSRPMRSQPRRDWQSHRKYQLWTRLDCQDFTARYGSVSGCPRGRQRM